MRSPLVSVVVLNYNGSRLLDGVLRSLDAQTYPNIETIVADNGSTDASQEVARRYRCEWVSIGFNSGFGPGNNFGARAASGEFIWFLNNDMRVEDDCIGRMVAPLLDDSRVFAVDPMIYNLDGDGIQHGGPILSSVPWYSKSNLLPGIAVQYVSRPYDRIDVPWGCGGALLVRTRMFRDLAGFDPTFIFGYEDADLCWRAWRHGWRSRYEPGAKVYHDESSSFKANPDQAVRRVYSSARNRQRLIWKSMGAQIVAADLLSTLLYGLLRLVVSPRHDGARAAVLGVGSMLRNVTALRRLRRELASSGSVDSGYLLREFLAIGRRGQSLVRLP